MVQQFVAAPVQGAAAQAPVVGAVAELPETDASAAARPTAKSYMNFKHPVV